MGKRHERKTLFTNKVVNMFEEKDEDEEDDEDDLHFRFKSKNS